MMTNEDSRKNVVVAITKLASQQWPHGQMIARDKRGCEKYQANRPLKVAAGEIERRKESA